jgi:hypothetical protein
MQGALTVVTAAVLAAALTSPSSAQVPGVNLPQAPQVQVPQAPQVLVPQAPQVQLPQVTAPSAPAPAPAVPAPRLPAAPAPQVRLPPAPQVNLPSVSAPRLPPAAPEQSSAAAPRQAPAASTSDPGPSGPVAGAGASGSSPRARRAAQAARVRSGRGFLGTSYRTRPRLVHALSGCVQALPTQQERLLTLRYGVGTTDPQSAPEVARTLDLSASEYTAVRRRALQGLVRAARGGACEERPGGDTALPLYGSASLDPVGAAVASGADGRSSEPGAGAQEQQAALTGGGSGGGASGDAERRSGFTTPLALDKGEAPDASSVAVLLLAGALALLSLIALKPVLAGVRRKRSGV